MSTNTEENPSFRCDVIQVGVVSTSGGNCISSDKVDAKSLSNSGIELTNLARTKLVSGLLNTLISTEGLCLLQQSFTDAREDHFNATIVIGPCSEKEESVL